jgi:mycothiol synthase
MTTALPPLSKDFIVRAPIMEELEAITNLIITCDIADVGEPDFTSDDLLSGWQRPNFNLVTDARVILTPAGQIVGYTDVYQGRTGMFINPNTNVHPDYRGQGLEVYLFRISEANARQHLAETQSTIPHVIGTVSTTEQTSTLLAQEGYVPIKHDWRMEIELKKPPPVPVWPAGISVRAFVPGQDEHTVHRIIQEAFSDLTHHVYQPFEEWEQWAIKRNDFDPFLVFLVMAGEEPAGTVLCYNYPDEGWVRQISVLRQWRGRGIALQLLQHIFGEFYGRDKRRVGLTVDSQNATGATRLYERAGMHIVFQLDTYEKKLNI